MGTRQVCSTALIAALCLWSCAAGAEETKDELKAKLRDVQMKMSIAANTLNDALQKLNNETEGKIEVVKKEFHAKRDAFLQEKDAKTKELRNAYKTEVAPLKEEEKRLMTIVGPTSNFAKTKTK